MALEARGKRNDSFNSKESSFSCFPRPHGGWGSEERSDNIEEGILSEAKWLPFSEGAGSDPPASSCSEHDAPTAGEVLSTVVDEAQGENTEGDEEWKRRGVDRDFKSHNFTW